MGATHGAAPRQELRTTGIGSNPTAPPARMLNVSELREHRTLRTTTSETRKLIQFGDFPLETGDILAQLARQTRG